MSSTDKRKTLEYDHRRRSVIRTNNVTRGDYDNNRVDPAELFYVRGREKRAFRNAVWLSLCRLRDYYRWSACYVYTTCIRSLIVVDINKRNPDNCVRLPAFLA